MRSNLQLHQYRRNHRGWLYSVVFTGKLSLAAILLLLLSFLIQPFHQALANEANEEAEPTAALPDDVTEQLPTADDAENIEEAGSEKSSIEEPGAEEGSIEVSATAPEETEVSTEVPEQNESLLDETVTSDEGITNDETIDPTGPITEDPQTEDATDETNAPVVEEGSSDSLPEVADSTDDSESGSDSTGSSEGSDDLINQGAIEASVNDLVGSVVNEVVTLTRQMVTEENFYQFSRQSCVAVGDGTFHCTSKERATLDPDSDVYAERDETGDMEIYLRTTKGDIKQLSDNDYDDTAPDMDLASMRAVWQRLIDGRYQIISYDLEERKETQLTFSRTNSMEPKVAEEGVVWQAWDGNDWEIMFFDGQVTDQITDNEIQDVTPVIEDGYVLWSVLGGEASEARVYSIESGELMTITGHEGGAVANPRFVLVYDTKFDNGDVITQGFDPVTGLATPLSSKPAELPFNIPEPDPVGEIRALINNKSTQKDKEIVTVPVSSDGGDLNLAVVASGTVDTLIVTDQLDLDDDGGVLPSEPESDFELTEYDLVITDEASSTNSVLNKQFYLDISTAGNASSTQR